MEFAPRLRQTLKQQPLQSQAFEQTVNQELPKYKEKVQEDEPEQVVNKCGFNYKPVVIVFGIIIIALVIVIVYIMYKKDKENPDLSKSSKIQQGQKPKQIQIQEQMNQIRSPTHSEVVNNVSEDKLMRYASKPAVSKPPSVPKIVEVEEPDQPDQSIEQPDDHSESKLGLSPEDSLGVAFAKIDKDTDEILESYESESALLDAHFIPEKVIECCKGRTEDYAGFKWKFD